MANKILPRKRMPARTVRLGGIDCGMADAAHDVLLDGYWLKMGRIHAVPVSAQVIQDKSVRNLANDRFVDQSMRTVHFIFAIFFDVDVSISALSA